MKIYIDIGTNLMQGFREISQLENINDEWKKIFVEPNPECWPDIENSIKYLTNSIFYKKAISSEKKIVKLITRSDNKKDMAATILGEDYLKASLSKWNIYVNDFNTYDIETITLDEVFKEINHDDIVVLKIDAEGVEYEILNDILEKNFNIKKIYCEFHIHSEIDRIKKQELIIRISDRMEFKDWH